MIRKIRKRFYIMYIYNYHIVNLLIFVTLNVLCIKFISFQEITNQVDIIQNDKVEDYVVEIKYSVCYVNGDIYMLNDADNAKNNFTIKPKDYVPTFNELKIIDNEITSSERFTIPYQPSYFEISRQSEIIRDLDKGEPKPAFIKQTSIDMILDKLVNTDEVLSKFNYDISPCITLEELIKTSFNAVKDINIVYISTNDLYLKDHHTLVDIYISKFNEELTISPKNIHLFKVALYAKYESEVYSLSLEYNYDQIYNIYYKYLGETSSVL